MHVVKHFFSNSTGRINYKGNALFIYLAATLKPQKEPPLLAVSALSSFDSYYNFK